MNSSRPAILGGTPLLETTPAWPKHGKAERDALLEVLESGRWAYDGPAQTRFERRFGRLQGVRGVRAVANGTVALQVALESLDIGRGDEVIVPGLTWQATAAAVADVNAIPVLADVEPDTYCLDLSAAEAAITERTKAIMVVHLYGSFTDLRGLLDLAWRYDLFVVEDCAHAHGARWEDKGAGSVGDMGCFSFQSSKTLTAGEGGCVTTDDDNLLARVYSRSNCGRPADSQPRDPWRWPHGGNHRMTEWQSAVLCAQLERFPEQQAVREQVRDRLDAVAEEIPGLQPMMRREQTTVAPAYAYVLRYEAEQFDGLPVGFARKALSADLGCQVEPPYEPLNRSSLYKPLTKQRHRLDPDYESRLEPSRIPLPVSERAFSHEGLVLPHTMMLNHYAPELLEESLTRLRKHLPELLRRVA